VIVAPGETLADIARRWGTTVAALMMANDLVNDRVQPGRSLQLPAASRR
jgi:LysM repeat protein